MKSFETETKSRPRVALPGSVNEPEFLEPLEIIGGLKRIKSPRAEKPSGLLSTVGPEKKMRNLDSETRRAHSYHLAEGGQFDVGPKIRMLDDTCPESVTSTFDVVGAATSPIASRVAFSPASWRSSDIPQGHRADHLASSLAYIADPSIESQCERMDSTHSAHSAPWTSPARPYRL